LSKMRRCSSSRRKESAIFLSMAAYFLSMAACHALKFSNLVSLGSPSLDMVTKQEVSGGK
jgi:hypothetical protein